MAKDYLKFKVFCDLREDTEAFIVGDIHGCWQELRELLERLGCYVADDGTLWALKGSPASRKRLIFVGDLVDRGPDTAAVLRLFMKNWRRGADFFPVLKAKESESGAGADSPAELPLPEREDGQGRVWSAVPLYCVLGNHDYRLWRLLQGCKVKLTHGLDATVESLERACREQSAAWGERSLDFPFGMEDIAAFFRDLPLCLRCGDRLVVSHAGLSEELQHKEGDESFHFCLFGDTHGKLDERGFPIRNHWEEDYEGRAAVFYGHTPVRRPLIVNNTVNIDTGCVFGGFLTAVSYPELDFISVKSRETYCERDNW